MQSYSAEHIVLQKLTGNASLSETDINGLREIVNNYPYFGAAYFLLSKKMQQEQDGHFEKNIQKTALHFQNPLWLYYNLAEFSDKDVTLSRSTLYKEIQESRQQKNDTIKAEEEIISAMSVAYNSDSNIAADAMPADPVIEEVQPEDISAETISAETGSADIENDIEIINTETVIDAETSASPESDTDQETTVADEHEPADNINSSVIIDQPLQDDNIHNEENTEIPVTEFSNQNDIDIIKAESITAEEEIFFSAEVEPSEDVPPATAKESVDDKLSGILDQQLQEFKKPVEENAEIPVAAEPYYRVDYFASQGIKLKPEDSPEDALGTRLRSFTGWLRQMKKLTTQPADLGTTTADELAVQAQAAHSNEMEEVYTEAMADVLVKQGKPEKAIAVYEKLSFLDPAKSFYFAAKIFELKAKLK